MWFVSGRVEVVIQARSDIGERGLADIQCLGAGDGFFVTDKEIDAFGILVRPELLLPRCHRDIHERTIRRRPQCRDGVFFAQLLVEVFDGRVDLIDDLCVCFHVCFVRFRVPENASLCSLHLGGGSMGRR